MSLNYFIHPLADVLSADVREETIVQQPSGTGFGAMFSYNYITLKRIEI